MKKKLMGSFLLILLTSCHHSEKTSIHVLDDNDKRQLTNATVINVNTREMVNYLKGGAYVLHVAKNDQIIIYCAGYDTAKFKINSPQQEYFVTLNALSHKMR